MDKVLKDIDSGLNINVSIFVIGGAALLHYGVGKGYTKDIDIIVENEKECEHFKDSLRKLRFKDKTKPETHNQLEMCAMLERGEIRFDIFLKIVCNDFSLSNSMIKRAKLILELPRLKVYVCSKEDIVLFKSLTTDRPMDIEDSVDLIKRGIDWEVILQELFIQSRICSDKDKVKGMIHYFIERMHDLKKEGITIPIEKKVYEFYDSF